MTRELTGRALDGVREIEGLDLQGPLPPADRAPLLAFDPRGRNPVEVAEELDARGVESRAGCHRATLAHRAPGLDPPASCRLSLAVYNPAEDVDRATDALRSIAGKRLSPVGRGR
ncbi:aminotransferase class V-fold PLP-dependent enzyme [Actinoplanes sp. NPDC020271]|uniref:aminotransferase class V-fold PLP-dependent enzyme n=1 Tax=Actinoplanes sp. NPDC020271 TaxID=3363896 RepID=UPI0037A5BD7D